MADMLIKFVRNYLVAEGIVRVPSVAGVAPPLWLMRKNGTPEPGINVQGLDPVEQNADLQINLVQSTGQATVPMEGEYEYPYALFRFFSRTPQAGHAVHKEIKAALDDKRNWNMAGQQVIMSTVFRDWQFVSSDNEGFRHITEYRFQVRS
jgi:hypothetical protein